ncbi:MAG: NTP/NDP exchange transporter [Hyphomicrobiaceae bacterium]
MTETSGKQPSHATEPGPASRLRGLAGLLARVVHIEPAERAAVLWSFAYFFSVLCAYYIIRPLRDEMGVTITKAGGSLEWLFVIVFIVMLAAVPVFGWVVSNFARKRVAPVIYIFFMLNLGVFWLLLKGSSSPLVASAFFVWVSVFNLFVVSLFWSVMADLWSSGEAKRLYGFIAAGGSAGAFTGPLITQSLVHSVGTANLLLISALFLGLALVCIWSLRGLIGEGKSADSDAPAGSGIIDGMLRVAKDPYLFRIALWVMIANLISTFFYFEQARIVGAALPERVDRVQLFARMDLTVSVLTIAAQLLITGNVLKRLGVGLSVAALPASAVVGLAAIAISPTLWVIVAVIVIERAIGFAISNPGARVLYTVVEPEDKYKAQNFIDTVVFRGGDAASGWVFSGLGKALGLATSYMALVTIPFALAWFWLSLRLGTAQEQRAARKP